MQIETHGNQIEVTPALREYVDNRFERLGRHFEHPCQIRVHLSLDKPQHKAEATVTLSGRTLHADAAAVGMYAAIALLADKLDRLRMKHTGKMVDHRRGEGIAQNDAFG